MIILFILFTNLSLLKIKLPSYFINNPSLFSIYPITYSLQITNNSRLFYNLIFNQIFANKLLTLFPISGHQYNMQKLRARSQAKLYEKQLLPTLKLNTSSFVSRTIIPISKFDLDSNFVLKEQRKFRMMSTIQPSLIKEKLIPKSKKSLLDSFLPSDHVQKILSSDSRRDMVHQNNQDQSERLSYKNMVNIDLSKTSSKSYGWIRGYAANSHPGMVKSVNEDRICIVTNLNKTSIKTKQVSFFSIYDGSENISKADYYRDNFHLILNSQQDLLIQPQKAIKSTIQKIEKFFQSNMVYTSPFEHQQRVSLAIMVTVGQSTYLIITGSSQITISYDFGQNIQKINTKPHSAHKKINFKGIKKNSLNKTQYLNIIIKKIPLNNFEKQIDFILLSSEGLSQKVTQQDITKKLWSYIINSKFQNIHSVLGEGTLNLLYHIFTMPNTKSTSLILVGFKNLEDCIKKNQKLTLPHIDE